MVKIWVSSLRAKAVLGLCQRITKFMKIITVDFLGLVSESARNSLEVFYR